MVKKKSVKELQAEILKLEREEQKIKADKVLELEESRLQALRAKKEKDNLDLVKKSESYFTVGGLLSKYRRKFKGAQVILANMELLNGHHTTILAVVDDKGKFKYRGGTYIVDDTLKYYHLGYKDYLLDYHQGFTMPIKRKIPLNDINETVQQTKIGGVQFATNPSTLKTFLVNNVVQSAIQGASITDFFRQVRLLVILAAVSSVIHLGLWMYQSGMFSGVAP